MSEAETVAGLERPNTRLSLAADLRALGLAAGDTVLAHVSLSSMGWVCGGAVALIQALEDVVTPGGTLVMPAHSGHLSDPRHWRNPPVPEPWWPTIRDQMPLFDPALTPTHGLGVVAETFRRQRGVVRSRHPQLSFAAWGRQRRFVTEDHGWDYPLGVGGPLGRIYDLNGRVLLLGVDHDRNTSLHLAETLAQGPGRREVDEEAPWSRRRGRTLWRPLRNVVYNDGAFLAVGAAFEAEGEVNLGRVGRAPSRLMAQRTLVDFAQRWLETNRY